MSQGISDAKLGVFVLAALTILVLGSLWIAGSSILGPERVEYVVVMHDSAGLQSGDRVRYAGVAVGRIQTVLLRPAEPWPVTMTVSIRPDIPVRADSRAQIGTAGMFGEVFLDIVAGSAEVELLSPGGRIEGQAGPGFDAALAKLDELSVQAGELLESTTQLVEQLARQVGPVLENVERLTSAENSENLRLLLADLRQLTSNAGPRLSAVLGSLEEGVAGIPELRQRLSTVIASVDSALGPDGERLAAVLERAEQEIGAAGGALSILTDNRQELEAALRDLRDALANLKAFSEEVRQRPSSLVRDKPRPQRRPGDPMQEPKP